MKTDNKELIIKILNLQLIEDIEISGSKVYGLKINKRVLGFIFDDKFEILEIEEDKRFKRLFKSSDNNVQDLDDIKIILNYLLDSDEIKIVNNFYSKRK